jgi:site-specific DNA-methyltransferase (cytosine-N4-specific)
MPTTTIYNMDVLQGLAKLPSESVDCIITSPPYYGLRAYPNSETIWDEPWLDEKTLACFGHEWGESIKNPKADYRTPEKKKSQNAIVGNSVNSIEFATGKMGNYCTHCGAWKGQLGLEPDYKMYLNHMLQITAELKRVLKPSGTLWWNMGDTYNGNKEGKTDKKVSDPVKDTQIGLKKETQAVMKEKCLMMLPERFAINMIEQGWILRNKIIWYKPNHMPSSVKDRLSNSYEFIFFFTKSRKYYFNLDKVRVPNLVVGVTDMRPAGILRQRLYDGSRYNESDDPHLAQFKYDGKILQEDAEALGSPRARELRYNSKNTNRNNTNPAGKNPGDIWRITTQPFTEAHFACFPPQLPEYAIDAGCPDNGIVLDPFAGSGTTLQVAHEKRLEGIGIEINPKYVEIIKKRLHAKELLNREEFVVIV